MACQNRAVVVLILVTMVTMMCSLTSAITREVIQEVVRTGQQRTIGGSLGNTSEACMEALDYLLFGKDTNLQLHVFDAFGKPEAGILQGNFHWLGHFDGCRAIPTYQYCATFFQVNLTALLHTPTAIGTLAWGICVPDKCSEGDIQSALNYIMNGTNFPVEPISQESAVSCAPKDHIPYSGGFIGTVTLFSAIFLLMLVGAAYDMHIKHQQKKSKNMVIYTGSTNSNNVPTSNGIAAETLNDTAPETNDDDDVPLILKPEPPKIAAWEQFLLAFALNRNLAKLLNTNPGGDRGIECLNGIRVLSMSWVILGHAFFFPMEMGVAANLPSAYAWFQRFPFQAIGNAYLSVDSFFFLSGLLVTYITLKKMAKRNGCIPWGWYYFHRYWRLTPAILATTLIWMYIKPYMGDSPLWKSFQNVESCSKYWWTNILYINNFYPLSFMHECIGWVWYLANDMQFFLISPLILIPLYYIPWLGLSLITVLLAASFAVTGALIGIHNVGPNGIPIPGLPAPTLDYSSQIYAKPYCRIPPYLVGMILGYMMYRQGDRKLNLHSSVYAGGWVIATTVGMSVVYGLQGLYHGHFTLAESIVYESLSRFAWGVALAWVVFACKEGFGGWVNDILSWRAWLPLSRVTYSAYLLHPIVIYIFLGNLKSSMMASLWLQPVYFVGYFVLSYGAAFMMALFIEFPFGNMEKIFMPSQPK